MISDQYKFIFIHIPKTGGSSIQYALKDYSEEDLLPTGNITRLIGRKDDPFDSFHIISKDGAVYKHANAAAYKLKLGPQLFSDYLKIGCVRNPWERMLSYYIFRVFAALPDGWNRFDSNGVPLIFDDGFSTEHFHKNIIDTRLGSMVQCLSVDDCFVADEVIQFENLQSDYERVCNRLGIIPKVLPHKNKTRHGHYTEYYDDKTRKLVSTMYADDIERFGYTY